MAAADRFTGSALVVTFLLDGDSSAVTLSGNQTAFSMNRKADTVDVTAGSETTRSFIPTLKSLDWTLNAFDITNGTAYQKVKEGAVGTMTVYPLGTASGKPMYQFKVVVTTFNRDMPFDGAVEIELGGNRTGAMIKDEGDLVA